MSISRRTVIQGLAALGTIPVLGSVPRRLRAEQPATVRLDYAYYNPSSLALRFGWLEEALQEQGIGVEWVLSAGSNKANEYLRSEAGTLDRRQGRRRCWRAPTARRSRPSTSTQAGVDGAGRAGRFPITSVAELKGKKSRPPKAPILTSSCSAP